MKLWEIWQDVNTGYDVYDSAVVAAETELAARMTHPNRAPWDGKVSGYKEWCASEDVQIRYLGEAAPGIEAGVIVAAFTGGLFDCTHREEEEDENNR